MRRLAVFGAVILGIVALRAGFEAPDPQAVTAEPLKPAEDTALARGRVIYERYGCSMCHGADAKGGRANTNAETAEKIPGLTKVAEGYTEAELIRLIGHGTSRIGKADASGPVPPFRMPGWGDRLTEAELRDLVRYLMSLAPKSGTGSWR